MGSWGRMLDSGTFTCRKGRRMAKEGEKHNYPECTKESVAAAWQVSRTEAVLHHLAIRPGCIGTRGPCLPSRHAAFLSPLPRFITQCSARHRKALHHFLYTAAVCPITASQPGLPKDQAGYMLPLRHQATVSLNVYCRGNSGRTLRLSECVPAHHTDELKQFIKVDMIVDAVILFTQSNYQCWSKFGHICSQFVLYIHLF